MQHQPPCSISLRAASASVQYQPPYSVSLRAASAFMQCQPPYSLSPCSISLHAASASVLHQSPCSFSLHAASVSASVPHEKGMQLSTPPPFARQGRDWMKGCGGFEKPIHKEIRKATITGPERQKLCQNHEETGCHGAISGTRGSRACLLEERTHDSSPATAVHLAFPTEPLGTLLSPENPTSPRFCGFCFRDIILLEPWSTLDSMWVSFSRLSPRPFLGEHPDHM